MDLSVALQITLHVREGISASASHCPVQPDGALGDRCWAGDDSHEWNSRLLFVEWFLLFLHDQSWEIDFQPNENVHQFNAFHMPD
jgi:hypothetical protein